MSRPLQARPYYRPILELLEPRLPPGEALLSSIAAGLLAESFSMPTWPPSTPREVRARNVDRPIPITVERFDSAPTSVPVEVAAQDERAMTEVRQRLGEEAAPPWRDAAPGGGRVPVPAEAGENVTAFVTPGPLTVGFSAAPPTSVLGVPPSFPGESLWQAAAVLPVELFGDDEPGVMGGENDPVLRGESPFIYGIHDMPGNLGTLDGLLNRRGWVLLMKYLKDQPAGYDPVIDQLADAGYGVVVRLHWDTGDGEGTVPAPSLYATFASRARQTVQNNPSAKYWIIGNETNLCSEWPRGTGFACNGTRRTSQITPETYAQVYLQAYDRIHELDGTVPNLHVIPAPTGVWAGDIPAWGVTDFLCDFTRMMNLIPHNKIDAFAFHPKTHTHSPTAITSLAQSPPDFDCGHNQRVYWEFPVYRDLMARVPADLRDRKVFFTELNPHEGAGWMNVNNGYLVEAYDEVNRWNRGQVAGWTGQRITGMMVYRWEGGEPQWRIDNKGNVQQDLRNAAARGHRWDFAAPWSAWTRISTGVTSAAPAAVSYNGQLIVLHRGDDRQVYVSRSVNGTTWSGWQLVTPGPVTDTAPALVVYAGYLFALATGTDGYTYFSITADGVSWSEWYGFGDYLGTTRTLAAVDYFGYLVVLARGEDRRLYLMFTDESFQWTGWYEVPHFNGLTDFAPAMVVFNDLLTLVVVGTNNSVYTNAYDPYTDTWRGWTLAFSGLQADRAVAAAVFDSRLYLLRKDPGAGTLSSAWTADGTAWNAWQSTGNGGSTNEAPALAAFNGRLYGLRKDSANRGVYVSSTPGG